MTLKLMKLKQRHSVYTGEGSEIFTLVWPKLLRPHPITVLQQHTSSCQAILSLLCIQRQVKQCQQGQGREGQGGENQLLYYIHILYKTIITQGCTGGADYRYYRQVALYMDANRPEWQT